MMTLRSSLAVLLVTVLVLPPLPTRADVTPPPAMTTNASNAQLPDARINLGVATSNFLSPVGGDNSPQLQTAFNASATVPVWLNCGVYNIDTPLSIPVGGIVQSALTWNYNGTNDCAVIKARQASGNFGAGTYVVQMGDYSVLRGVAVEGTNTLNEADALKINGVFATVDNNFLRKANNGLSCVDILNGPQVTHNLVGYNRNNGVNMPSGCSDTLITGNSVFSNNARGMAIYGNGFHIVTENRIESNVTYGLEIFNGSAQTIANNNIVDNSGVGLRINGSGGTNFNVTITGNVFQDNGRAQGTNGNCHIEITGTNDQLVMAGNVFKTGTGGPAGAPVPDYVYCGSAGAAPNLTHSLIADAPPAQVIGIYENATIQGAVRPLVMTPPLSGYVGGTAVNNGASTITVAGNLATGGALTFANLATTNQLLYATSANNVGGLATANNGVLITSGAGVPSISSTLPSAVQGNITSTGTLGTTTVSGLNILSGFNYSILRNGSTGILEFVGNQGGSATGYSFNGAVKAQVATVSKTGAYTVLAADSGVHFDNIGAAGSVTFTLPAAAAGLNYCFLVSAAQTVVVAAASGEKIAIGLSNSAATGNITATAAFSQACLEAHAASQWVARSATGTWTVN